MTAKEVVCGFCEKPIDRDRDEWGTLSLPVRPGRPGEPFMDVHRDCFVEPDDDETEIAK